MSEIFVRIELVRQCELFKIREPCRDNFGQGIDGFCIVAQKRVAKLREFEIGFTSDDIVSESNDGLIVPFMRDFRAAKNDVDIGSQTTEHADDFSGLDDVPDIHAEADDAGFVVEDCFENLDGSLIDLKFGNGGAMLQWSQIGHEITKAKSAVDILGVEGGEDDVWHSVRS